ADADRGRLAGGAAAPARAVHAAAARAAQRPSWHRAMGDRRRSAGHLSDIAVFRGCRPRGVRATVPAVHFKRAGSPRMHTKTAFVIAAAFTLAGSSAFAAGK